MDDVFEMGDPRYAAQVMPELFPKERQPVLKNWSDDDLEMFCGIYTTTGVDAWLIANRAYQLWSSTTFGPGTLYDTVIVELPAS